MSSGIALKNPNLESMSKDCLYHLGIVVENTENATDIQKLFGDVKVICMGGTASRMRELAMYLETSILKLESKTELVDLAASGNRYSMYKVGPVLCVNHGIGMSTFSVVLHELLKLIKYAKCEDPVFIRVGTCGGINIDPGTVVVTKDAYNGLLKNEHEIFILGKRVVRPAKFDVGVMNDILTCGSKDDAFETISGNTMATDCFYEGQGRTDGAVCEYTEKDKMEFLNKCKGIGIRNIEMEATMYSSLTLLANVKAADICVTLVDRLNGDQVDFTVEKKKEFEFRPFLIVGRYVKKVLSLN